MASEFRRRELVIRIPAQDDPSSRIRGASPPSDFGTVSGVIQPLPAPRSRAAPAAEPVLPWVAAKDASSPRTGRPAGLGPYMQASSGRRASLTVVGVRLGQGLFAPLSKPARRREGRLSMNSPQGHRRDRRPPGANPALRPTWRGRRAGGFPSGPRRPAALGRQTKPQSVASSIRAGVSIPSTPVAGSRKTTCSTPAVRSPSASRCWRAAPGRHSASTAARTASLTRR